MCMICKMLEDDFITFIEADRILYSGEVKMDPEHFVEVLEKIDEKQKEQDGTN